MQLIPSVTIGGTLTNGEAVGDALEPLGVQGEPVVLIDERGINENRPRYDPIRHLGTDYELWVDPGIRDTESVVEPLMLGASEIIIASKTLLSLKELEGIAELTDNVILAVDWARKVMSSIKSIQDTPVEKALTRMREAMEEIEVSRTIVFNHTPDALPRDVFRSLDRMDLEVFVATEYKHLDAMEDAGAAGIIVDHAQILAEEV